MSIPLQVQLFDAFLGTHEGIHSLILPDIFSSGGSKNVFIDRFGRVAQIDGYIRNNASAYLAGGQPAKIAGLIPYKATGGGATTWRLIVITDDDLNFWEIKLSANNGTSAVSLETTSVPNLMPDAAQFGDNLYITNGNFQPRKFDGTSLTTTGLTRSPTPTIVANALSGVLTGDFQYKMVSLVGNVRQNGSVMSNTVMVDAKQMDVSWAADSNLSVTGYEIYRTTGVGSTFYYLTSIVGRLTVSYVDNISDNTILENRAMEEHGEPPPTGAHYVEPHKQRMWWLRTDTYPTRAYWSDPSQPESVYPQSFLDFSDSETVGDVITGALGNYEGLFVVFTEKAIWTVSGTGAIIGDIVDWTKTRTNCQIGAVTSRAACRVPAGSKYADQTGQVQTTTVNAVAYWTPLGDIRLFDGENDVIISSPVNATIRNFTYSSRKRVHCVQDPINDQIIWFFPSNNEEECNKAVAWSYRYGTWYVWDPMPFSASAEVDTATDSSIILTGESHSSKGGFVYTFQSGGSFDGDFIDSQWMTKTLYGVNEQGQPALTNVKRWRWVDLLFNTEANIVVLAQWFQGTADDNGTPITPGTGITTSGPLLMSGSGSFIITADGSFIQLGQSNVQTKVLLHDAAGRYLHDEGIRLRIQRKDSVVGGWALEGMNLAYQIMPGLKRRDQE